MSRLFLSCVLLSFICCVSFVSADFPCTTTQNGAYYDLSSLSGTDIKGKAVAGSGIFYQYTYYMNVCGTTTTAPCGGHNAMICQVDVNGNYVSTTASSVASSTSPKWAAADAANPNAGVVLTLQGDGGCNGANRISIITFQCDPTATAAVTTFNDKEMPTCTHTFTIITAAACPVAPGGGSASKGKISGGTVFLIILSVSLFVYVVAGCAYKRSKLGTSGMMESCPNNEFWSSLPGLVKDGAKFFANKCRSLCDKGSSGGGQSSSYESI